MTAKERDIEDATMIFGVIILGALIVVGLIISLRKVDQQKEACAKQNGIYLLLEQACIRSIERLPI